MSSSENAKVVVKKIIKADIDLVFNAWTDPAVMQKWLYPGDGRAVSENQLKVGGQYKQDMIFDKADPACKDGDGTIKSSGEVSYLHYGEYLEINPPQRLVFTWNSPSVKNTKVTVELKAVDGGTEVSVTHELIEGEQLREGHTKGWHGCLENLDKFFSA